MGKHKGVNCIYLCPPNREVKKYHCTIKNGETGTCYRMHGAKGCNYQQEKKSMAKKALKEQWIVIEGEDKVARRYSSRAAMMECIGEDFNLSATENVQVLHVNIINEYEASVVDPIKLTPTGE